MIENELLIKVFLFCIWFLVTVVIGYKCCSLVLKIDKESDIKNKLYEDMCNENGDVKFDSIQLEEDNTKWVSIDICKHGNKVLENNDKIIELQNKLINYMLIGGITIILFLKLIEYIIVNLI